jgi:hypothetical protein
MGAALLTDLDLRSLRCLICGCPADGNTFRISQAEDGCWMAICHNCCQFFGAVSARYHEDSECRSEISWMGPQAYSSACSSARMRSISVRRRGTSSVAVTQTIGRLMAKYS